MPPISPPWQLLNWTQACEPFPERSAFWRTHTTDAAGRCGSCNLFPNTVRYKRLVGRGLISGGYHPSFAIGSLYKVDETMKKTNDSLLAKAISQSVQPAVQEIATRLFYLTTFRPGSKKHKPSVLNIYETTFAQSIYEHLLMAPVIGHLEVRHEAPCGRERVDLWIRNFGGGQAHFIEIGFFTKKKVEDEFNKLKRLKPKETRWFLALFRGPYARKHPKDTVTKSLNRKNGLDNRLMTFNQNHSGHFEIYRPGKPGDCFGYALIKGK